MRKFYLVFVFSTLFGFVSGQNIKPEYDSELAQKYVADEYGMKNYMFVILKTGQNATNNKTLIDSLFRGHLDNIGKLAKEGKLVVAGPFSKNEHQYRGLFILDVKTKEEAEMLLQTDPAVKSGLLAAEIIEWYGSAALPAYLEVHKKIEKQSP